MNTRTIIAMGVISAASLSASAGGITSWDNAAGGDWALGANWSTGVVPTSSDSVAIGLTGAYTVSLSSARSAGSLSISNIDAILAVQFGSTFSMSGNLDNNGSIEINVPNAGATTTFNAVTDMALGGNGRLFLGGVGSRARIQTLNGSTLNHASNHTIEGIGQISALLQNNGLVRANITASQMLVNGFDKTNLGTFEATNGGIMEINGTTVTQLSGGEIVADGVGSQVELLNATIDGGDLLSLNGADIELSGTSALNNVDFMGLLNIPHGSTLHLSGTWVNNGDVVHNSTMAAATTTFDVNTSLTFEGSGSLNLTSVASQSRLRTAAKAVLTQGPNHTIFGQGQIEADFVNNGMVSANSEGNQMLLNVNDKVNNATFQAVDGGTMEFNAITVTQGGGGQIIAEGAGSQVEIVNTTVFGGAIKSGNTADIEILGTTMLSGVSSEGLMNIPHGNNLRLSDSWTNQGTVVLNSTAASATTTMFFEDSMTIAGEGEIQLIRAGSQSRIRGADGVTITLNPDHTIFGQGQIEVGMINNGLVSADVDGSQMLLNVNDKTNNATMQAVGGGILEVNAISIDLSAGGDLMVEGVGSQIELINATIIGGDLLSMNGGDFEATGTNLLDGVVFVGAMNIPHGNNLQIVNSIENNGIITLNSTPAGATTTLVFNDTSSLMGTGSLVLTRAGSQSRVQSVADQVIVHSADHTIEGLGQIEADMVNNGLISANSTGGQMLHNLNNKVNNSTMEAVNGGILEINAITIEQGPSGEIVSDGADSQIELVNATVVGGMLMSQNGADVEVTGNTILDSVGFSGELRLPHNNSVGVKSGFTNEGLMIINSTEAGATTSMRWDDEFMIQGNGIIRLTRTGSLAQLTAIGGEVSQGGLGSDQRLEGIGQIAIDLNMDGTIAPGLSIGTMTATQPVDMSSSASFEAEVNDSASDLLDSSSTVDLEGTLDVLFIDGFAPTDFWVRTIVEGSDITGAFDTINAPTPPGSFVTRVVNTGTELLVGQTCLADMTLDGGLDFFDVSDFLNNFAAEDPAADFTNDGEYDFFDVSAFLSAFGSGCNP